MIAFVFKQLFNVAFRKVRVSLHHFVGELLLSVEHLFLDLKQARGCFLLLFVQHLAHSEDAVFQGLVLLSVRRGKDLSAEVGSLVHFGC